MIKNYLLITLRSMAKNKLFIIINVFGLAISVACCIVAYFNYDFNVSFDTNHINAATIYRINSVREFQNEQKSYGYVPVGLGNAIRQNVQDIKQQVRYSQAGVNFRIDTELFKSNITYVDRPFFGLFTFQFIEGNGELKDKSLICISDELAEKYFGKGSVLGKPITQMLDSGKTKEYTVAGVFRKPPSNSSFDAQAYVFYDNYFEDDRDVTENNWRLRASLT